LMIFSTRIPLTKAFLSSTSNTGQLFIKASMKVF
jgi:hypothetical protein